MEVAVNAYYRNISGLRYTPYQQLGSSTLNFPQSQRGRRLLLEPRGGYGVETTNALDLRLEKIFKLGSNNGRFGVYVDIRNVFNANNSTDAQDRYPSVGGVIGPDGQPTSVDFGAPVTILDPRQVTLAARWSF